MSEVLKAHLWRNQQSTFPFKLDRVAITSPLLRFENLMRLGLQLPSGSSPKSEPEQVEHVFLGLIAFLEALRCMVTIQEDSSTGLFFVINTLLL